MRLPRPTKINQRVLGSAVVGLLAANAFAAAVIAGDVGADAVGRPDREATAASAATAEPQTVTLITTADGRTMLVDPSTPAGRKAIAEAKRNGATTRDVPVASRTSPGATTLPGGLDLGQLLGRLPGQGGSIEIGQDVADQLVSGVDTITSVVDGAKTTASSVLDGARTTVSSVVDGTKTTVSSVVDGAGTTVSSLVGSTPSTVTSVVGGTQTTVSSVLNQVTPTTSLVGSVITTVSTVVQSVTPTTAAPAPTTVPAPVCGLLVHC